MKAESPLILRKLAANLEHLIDICLSNWIVRCWRVTKRQYGNIDASCERADPASYVKVALAKLQLQQRALLLF